MKKTVRNQIITENTPEELRVRLIQQRRDVLDEWDNETANSKIKSLYRVLTRMPGKKVIRQSSAGGEEYDWPQKWQKDGWKELRDCLLNGCDEIVLWSWGETCVVFKVGINMEIGVNVAHHD